jgi:uncharacterized protein (TIGR03503 family)
MIPTRGPFHRPCAALLFAVSSLVGVPAAAAAPPDVRILIDVSGSMQQNDPANLRIPALKLLTALLPAGATAGVWLFDETPQPLIAPRVVDANWKKQARAAADKVHSRGLFTHLEAGLDAASADWTTPAAKDTPRHIIVLTDGMVDVSKDTAASAASRARLLADGLTRFQVLGAKIHTVALSAHADAPLLNAIAKGTDGWFEQVNDATTLQRVFLHLFEQAAAPDGLPLKGNRFTVDTSVRELTVLVFHVAGAPELELTAPDGTRLTQATASESTAWQHQEGYDLVTLTAPRAGEWSFNAPQDPDNRAMIVTDLGLAVGELPTNLMPGEPLAVTAQLLEQGAPLTRADFLQLVKVDAATSSAAGAGELAVLSFDPAASNFSGAVATASEAGDYALIVRVDGGTFQRERHHRFKVNGPPFSFNVDSAKDDAGARVIHLTIAADPDVVVPSSFSGLLELRLPDAPPQVLELPALDGNEITLELPADALGEYVMQPWVFAETRATRALKLKPDPLTITFSDGTRKAPDAPPATMGSPPVAAAFSWAATAGVIAIGNVGLGSALGGLWFTLRRRGLAAQGLTL